MKVPFIDLNPIHAAIQQEMEQAFSEVYASNQFILGGRLERFEKEFAEFCETKFAIGVNSGTDALILSLRALEIGSGDEVVLPSNAYIATVMAVSQVGAIPVFVEPNERTFNIDPNRIESAISPRTKAIIPIHFFGQTCEMNSIMELAEKRGLFVIEDNAQAHGAEVAGKRTGSWGHLNATSFYPTKNLGALGDAGAITTDNEQLANRLRMLCHYGSMQKNEHAIIGQNSRLDELQAAFLSIKLKHLNKWNAERKKIANRYHEQLAGIGDLILPKATSTRPHVYHQYVIRTEKRDGLRQHLAKSGVETAIHYPKPPHLQEAYAYLGYRKGSFPIAERIAETSLSLPMFVGITEEQQEYVNNTTKAFYHA
ncbi:MAG: aminotransferase class V-fold PLP-dependent enzyme [Flavobacteriales bacterium]|nr:aminotransferase class V-fold PLP-dependent enzyme [Flavobacteriales bacterium]